MHWFARTSAPSRKSDTLAKTKNRVYVGRMTSSIRHSNGIACSGKQSGATILQMSLRVCSPTICLAAVTQFRHSYKPGLANNRQLIALLGNDHIYGRTNRIKGQHFNTYQITQRLLYRPFRYCDDFLLKLPHLKSLHVSAFCDFSKLTFPHDAIRALLNAKAMSSFANCVHAASLGIRAHIIELILNNSGHFAIHSK